MDIHIDRPILNRKSAEENIAILDRWVADTSDKLNTFILMVNRKLEEKESENK